MNAGRTARERARAELTSEIKQAARRQLATEGAGGLSLRAIARELGMVSSALYRYFANRDELLTALIIDAYTALADTVAAADDSVPKPDHRGRWRACCHALRDWAKANPHEYTLIYGSPVPGYHAPQDTVGSAARTYFTLLGVLADAHHAEALHPPVPGPPIPPALDAQFQIVADAVDPELPADVLNLGFVLLCQLFGMLNLELFGQFVGSLDPADLFFDHTVTHMADFAGLAPDSRGESH